ncbi:MAG: hypothetical protein HYY17_06780 [Planctomycetes bacterium]|nr:hypothetical protein [Planctomycetota bacterium]
MRGGHVDGPRGRASGLPALKGGFPAGDLRKAVRRRNALPVRASLSDVLRSELKVPDAVVDPIRASESRADRALLDEIPKIVVDEGAMTAAEFEKMAASVSAVMSSGIHPPIEVPPKLGEYEVRWEVRRDAHPGVFHGSHPVHGDVALKVFRQGSAPSGLKIRFGERHPGIVRILDIGEAEGFTFVVMELVEGQPLSKIVRGRKLTAREGLAPAEKAGRVLAEMHERGFHHGSPRRRTSMDLRASGRPSSPPPPRQAGLAGKRAHHRISPGRHAPWHRRRSGIVEPMASRLL